MSIVLRSACVVFALITAPHAGASPQDHSHMNMPSAGADEQRSTPPSSPREPIPPVSPADRLAAFPDVAGHAVHDETIHGYFLMNRLETWGDGPDSDLEWEGQGWIGTDLDRVWLRSEGTREGDETHAADAELLYGRAIARWWDVVAGVRQDWDPGESQTFAVVGIQGLAPQWFEVEATAYLGDGGQAAARFEVEYEMLITNKLILQPLVEINLFREDDPERQTGSGLSTIEAGLRLRYEWTRQLAPYVGFVMERSYGDTSDFRRDAGWDTHDSRFTAGIRLWF